MHKDDNFDSIVEKYLKPVYNFVFRLVGNVGDAEDITQETFVKVWKNIKKYDANKNFKTWIFTIARNSTIDFFRRRKNIPFSDLNNKEGGEGLFEEQILDSEPLEDEIFYKKELETEIEKVLVEIKPEYKEITILHVMEELTFDQISEITGKPLNTVKSQYRRALHQIKRLIRI